MNQTSIVILTLNNLEYNKSCIGSIRNFTGKGTYEIIVVDNHSTDGTVEWLKEQPDIKLVLNDENAGFPKGCNQGIAVAEEENDILLLNNDTIVTAHWLEALRECLYSDERVGAVGPVTNYCSYLQAIETHFAGLESMHEFAEKLNTSPQKDYEQRAKLIGFCMLIKRTVLSQIGPLDERFSPGNFEDDDYSCRIQLAGYKLLLCRNAFVFHFGSKSFFGDTEAFQKHLTENADKFAAKWGFSSGTALDIRHDLTDLIDANPNKVIRVLQIGCGCGATLLNIRYKYKNAELYGVEQNLNAAQIASSFANVQNKNIENAKLTFKKGFFDYIIFADVLCCLKDPAKVLCSMKSYLKKGGRVLVSLPNVMHFSVFAGLLNGAFTYAGSGILSREHLHFFTLGEIDAMFRNCGYSGMVYKSSVMPLQPHEKDFIDQLVKMAGEDKRAQFCAREYYIKAGN